MMAFRFQMRLSYAVVAHTHDCLRSFLSGLDETLAHCANDAQMSFVFAHINVSLASRCLDCVFTGQHRCIASAEFFSLCENGR
jgi:hypothetical protein